MATVSWNSSDRSGNWSDPNSWFDLATPDASAVVVLAGTSPYTSTVDVPFTVALVDVASVGVTLDIASTLTVSSDVTVAAGADVLVAGTFAAGTLDLSGGATLDGAGGTLAGTTVLGQIATLGATGALTNTGTVAWSANVAGPGTIAIGGSTFDNAGRFVLQAVTQTVTTEVVTSVNTGSARPYGVTTEVMYDLALGADTTIDAGTFDNSSLFALVGATLTINSAAFDNSGTIDLVDAPTEQLQQIGVVDGIAYYGVVDTTLTTGLVIGAQVTSFTNSSSGVITTDTLVFDAASFSNAGTINVGTVDFTQSAFTNTGTINAGSAVFAQAMTLAQLGSITGGLTFNAGLDLGGGTLSAATVSVGGLVQDGSIGGSGTLVLQPGATLDNVAIGTGVTVQELGAPVTIIDPPSLGAAVTLDANINVLDFNTVTTFNGGIVLGPGASNDVIGAFTPGGVTLGPNFSLTNDVSGSLLTVGGSSHVLNDGTWTLNGSSLDLATTLDNAAVINVENGATAEFATLDGSGALDLANGALVQVDTLAPTGQPSVAFGAGSSRVNLPGTGAIGAVLSGLTAGDQVDFFSVSAQPGTIFVQSTATVVDGSLDLTGASGDTASVAVASVSGSLHFTLLPDTNGGTIVQVACFAEGTRLAAARGEVAVEAVRPGDLLRTAAGALAPVRWVGWTRVDLARHPAPERAAPIRIAADAIAPGAPRRDLLLSAEHCLFLDGALVPVAALVNGATIARVDGLAAVTYWHVELDRHDVLLAEGLPAESYLDTGNRALFAGEAGVRTLHADFSGMPDAAALAVWARHGCAELRLTDPGQRTALWRRAEALGWRLGEDAGISVLADGAAAPWGRADGGIAVRLAAGSRRVRLGSRSFVPAEQQPGSGDMRRLGLAVASVSLGGWKLPAEALCEGWREPAGEAWRWTDGDAEIVLPRLTRPAVLSVTLLPLGQYWQRPALPVAVRKPRAAGRR